ncbi:MAG: recombinase family protein [Brevibacterium aurantiacum]|uniref:recombinase family protein n=1 Tax=Brevibacterium aurantiacum TaxID=273384 RepID=UPI003F903370
MVRVIPDVHDPSQWRTIPRTLQLGVKAVPRVPVRTATRRSDWDLCRTSPLSLVALYGRQAKADPDGIDRQIPRLRKLAAERGWAIAGEYVDDGMSAAKSS